MLPLNDTAKYQLAKSLTELAIQNNLITKYEDSAKTAEETVKFFDTITNMVGKSKITD